VSAPPASGVTVTGRATSTGGNLPGERTREVTLDPGASTDTPVRGQGPGVSLLPGPGAGHPCTVRAVARTATDSNSTSQRQASAVNGTRRRSHIARQLGISGLKIGRSRSVVHQPSRKPYSAQVQQRHRLRAAPSDRHRSVSCLNDRERPRRREFASRGSGVRIPSAPRVPAGQRPAGRLKIFSLANYGEPIAELSATRDLSAET
jgi:hypothetical protein